MTSTLTLYYKSLINKDKNFILDNPSNGKSTIETYLATLEKQVINDFQYVRQGLSVLIKINKTQDDLMMGHNARDLNYVKIQNGSENPCYYFIIKKEWKSVNTIELLLNMDTLNTFEYNKDYELNKKTLVKREHKDRFKKIPSYSRVFEFDVASDSVVSPTYSSMLVAISQFKSYSIEVLTGTTLTIPTGFPTLQETTLDGIHVFRFICRNTTGTSGHVKLKFTFSCYALQREVDMRSEEINSPVYKFLEETLYEQEGKSPASWSLYYKNEDNQDNSPVECYLLSDDTYDIKYQTSDGRIDAGDLPDNDYIILRPLVGMLNGNSLARLSVKVGDAYYTIGISSGWSWGNYSINTVLALKKNGANVDVYYAKFEFKVLLFPPISQYNGKWTKIGTFSHVEVQTIADTLKTHQVASLPTSQQYWLFDYAYTEYTINFSASATRPAMTIQDIDRTDETNIKIIDLPYSPTNFEIAGDGSYVVDSMWVTDPSTGAVKLTNTTARFRNDITSQAVNPVINLLNPYDSDVNFTNTNRFLKDSKLFHSDFFRPKFVYDSFNRVFPLEKIDFTANERESYLFKFHFTMSRNIVSKFMFSFDYEYKIATEDYEKVVCCSRNNEEVLYNSQFLNYLRTGYNYDLKAKEKQDIAGMTGIGLSALAIVGSIAVAVATENPLPIAGAVAGGISLVGQITNYAKTTAQSEDNIQRKLQESQNQAVSVLNADDVDLLYEYSENKAKLCRYKVSDTMESILDDLFYYGGYISNEQKVPNVRTRYWFNYVQASLIIEETNNLTEEIENDIKEKFDKGVTFLHLRNGTFDLRQEKENIEVSVL